MGKGAKKQLLANAGQDTANANTLTQQAGDVYGTLDPALTAEATHPGGFSPTDKAAMRTAGQQSAGGSEAAATGQGGLLAARTRNAGGADAAVADAARSAGQGLNKAAVSTEVQNAQLKQQQQQGGQRGLEGLYGTQISGASKDMADAGKAYSDAASLNGMDPWKKYLIDAAKGVAVGAATVGTGGAALPAILAGSAAAGSGFA